ncbi:MAG: hypothetical protein IT379_38545 [Deltaproteobacteria bacterium]|nr:hypothetical protein [Deltaproteobacteria bacterium]
MLPDLHSLPSPTPTVSPRTIRKLVLVYAADSGAWAILVDVAKKVLRVQGCTLCEITHGALGERTEWRSCRDTLGVPVEAFHRDDMPPRLRELAGDRLPCIVAEAQDGELVVVLEPEVIARCRGSAADLRGKLLFHVARLGLKLP